MPVVPRLQSSTRTPLMFIAVGCTAAAVHFAVALAIVRSGIATPLVANIFAWLSAFGVSFAGHQWLTFRAQRAPLMRAGLRFLLVSATGFAINEMAYAALLHWSPLPYDAALALVLIGVAVLTYLSGRHWAFRSNAR
jgi:putative flippase GtrA